MEVQVAITMKESLGQNHARNRLSAKSYRCSILEVGEPGDSAGNGITTREILKLSQLCGPGSAICDAGWPTPDCPWSMPVCRSQKKNFGTSTSTSTTVSCSRKVLLLAYVASVLCFLAFLSRGRGVDVRAFGGGLLPLNVGTGALFGTLTAYSREAPLSSSAYLQCLQPGG